MERALTKFRQLYTKMDVLLNDWKNEKEKGVSLIATCSSIIDRLPALQDLENYGVLKCVPDIHHRLLGKQLKDLESFLASLRNVLGRIEDIVTQARRIMLEGTRVLQSSLPRPQPSEFAVFVPPAPAPVQLVEGLQDIWRNLRDDFVLKKLLLTGLNYDTRPSEFAFLMAAFRDSPDVDEQSFRDMVELIQATAPAPR
eukprot:jgi/Botrbrau1/4554/Bobra.60_2s0041.1